jgi:DNA-binding GntR family transcriptional regulator
MSHSQSSTLAAAAEDRLRREIFDGQLPPGTRLAEAAEARRLGVSRVPVREAFAALERDGLLEFTETGRTVVKKLTPQDFEELFALRLLLEPSAARAAFPLSQKQRLLLEENISATRNAKTLDEVRSGTSPVDRGGVRKCAASQVVALPSLRTGTLAGLSPSAAS